MIDAYPLRTEPLFRDYLWGGRKLETVLRKKLPKSGAWAESWEIVDHPEHSSRISNGVLAGQSLRHISQREPHWLLGSDFRGTSVPLLLKYLDCHQVLSVQVHPDDDYAQRMSPPDRGKTEAWYIIAAEADAVLYAGLKHGLTRDDLVVALQAGEVEACLHAIRPQAGDCVFIRAGTVHALGAGLLVAEIQQASNTTFRLFDWNRVDAEGKPRPLHVAQSLEVIDFASGPCPLQVPQQTDQSWRERLVCCDKFLLDRISVRAAKIESATIAGDRRLHLLTVPRGSAVLSWQTGSDTLQMGESVLVPAAMPSIHVQLDSDAVLLDMYLP